MAKRLNALLPMMRWAVIGLAAAILVLSIIGLFRFPEYAAGQLDEFTPNVTWTGAQVQQALAELGWHPMSAAWYALINELFGLVWVYAISAAILWKKSRDWYGLFLMFVFIIGGPLGGSMLKPALENLPGLSLIIDKVLGVTSWQLFFLLFFFFPNGHPVPAWTGWFAAGYSVFMLSVVAFQEINNSQAAAFLGTLMVLLAIGSQVYRYLRQPDPVQRQQTKWVVFVLTYFLLLLPVMFLFGFQAPPTESLGPALLKDYGLNFMARLVFWLTPAAITIAVLRYRLWDIDLIIRRTLLYAALTAALGLVYFGSVVLLQQFFRAFSNQDSPLVVVLSTLAIATLFNPLRRRLQAAVDRRFYRQKYNAEQAVATFAATARRETELNAITNQMVSVVEETVQPEAVWVWMKDRKSEL